MKKSVMTFHRKVCIIYSDFLIISSEQHWHTSWVFSFYFPDGPKFLLFPLCHSSIPWAFQAIMLCVYPFSLNRMCCLINHIVCSSPFSLICWFIWWFVEIQIIISPSFSLKRIMLSSQRSAYHCRLINGFIIWYLCAYLLICRVQRQTWMWSKSFSLLQGISSKGFLKLLQNQRLVKKTLLLWFHIPYVDIL